MSRKYIREIINQNFIYPNNQVSEYDIELVQDINNQSIVGSVNSFSATTVNSTGITITMNYTWTVNASERFIRNSNELSLFSVHLMAPPQLYYKPFRTVYNKSTSLINTTTITETVTFTVLPSQLQLASFISGTYYFEVRLIGHTSILPICITLPLTVTGSTPTPTPTPTNTPTPSGPTPTPTPTSSPTPTPATYSIARVGSCIPNQIATTYSITGQTGDTVIVRATFTGQITASAAGSSATVTVDGGETESTSCFYSGTHFFTLTPERTFVMPSTTTTISTSAVTYEADETLTSLNVQIVSVNGVPVGTSVGGCRGDSTGGPC